MKYNDNQRFNKAVLRQVFAAAIAFGGALGMAANAAAQRIPSPPTSTLITPPQGNSAYLLGHGVGTQGYVCLPASTGASWTVNPARPEATLFASVYGLDFQIITHFLSPNTKPNKIAPDPLPFGNATWQSSLDSSKIWAQTLHTVTATSEPACPNSGAIGCLLLQVIGADEGPTGGKGLTSTTFIQRLNTKGGLAPTDGCAVAADVGKQALSPYSADYYFFRADK